MRARRRFASVLALAAALCVGLVALPASATAAPAAPPKREPNTTEKLTTLGPGRNWDSANASLNSSAVIHPRWSTIMRRAHGSAPPNPEMETTTKARNSSSREGRAATDRDGATESDMTAAISRATGAD